MKKNIFFAAFALLAVALTFSLTSCGGDDDNEGKSVTNANLKGTWRVTHLKLSAEGQYGDYSFTEKGPTLFGFGEDGSFSVYSELIDFYDNEGKYIIDGNTLNITYSGKTYGTIDILSLKGNTMEIKVFLTEYGTAYYRCTKDNGAAKALFVGQWGAPGWVSLDGACDKFIYEFTEEGCVNLIVHVSQNCPSSSIYYSFRNKYVFSEVEYDKYVVTPNPTDPTSGSITVWYPTEDDPDYSYTKEYSGLSRDGFYWINGWYSRIDPPVTYVVLR